MKLKFTLATLIALTLAACNSPLLNHADAEEIRTQEQAAPPLKSEACPLVFPTHQLCAELIWTSALNDQDPATFTLRFWNRVDAQSSGPFSDPPHDLRVLLWMPKMGHGSSPVSLTHALDTGGQKISGVFEGSQAYFIMPGQWEVRVQLKQGAQIDEESTLRVDI